MKPKVTIVILNWNGYTDTIECLESLQNIDYPNYDIIIVDNRSSDGSADKISKKFPDITLIRNNKNHGYAEGNNIGIKEALKDGPEYVLLLNNDIVVDRRFLSELVNIGESDPQIGILGPKIYYRDDPNRFWHIGSNAGIFSKKPIGYREIDEGQYDRVMEFDAVIGACILMKRSVVDKIGLMDKDYYLMAEDVDYCIRAKKAGFKIVYVPLSRVWHIVSASFQGEDSPLSMYYSSRNNLLLYKKNRKMNLLVHIRTMLRMVKYILLLFDPRHWKRSFAVFRGTCDYYLGKVGEASFKS